MTFNASGKGLTSKEVTLPASVAPYYDIVPGTVMLNTQNYHIYCRRVAYTDGFIPEGLNGSLVFQVRSASAAYLLDDELPDLDMI